MKLLGIDFGSKRVGVSVTDDSGKMAFPYAVFTNDAELLTKVTSVIEEKNISAVVIGYSLDREGKPNKIHSLVEEFITDLTLETGLPVHLEPEQYTTQAAVRIQGKNEMTDASAAALILENYLTRR